MALDQHTVDHRIIDNHRSAHRVFRVRKGVDRFNPFRHIPWVSKDRKDVEAGAQRHLRSHQIELQLCEIGRFKFKYPVPEEPFSFTNQIQRTILTSWINVFLICVPIGLYLSSRGSSPESFVFNYVAEFPLWFMCDYALEEMEKYIGRTTSDLLDIFTNNTVQVISSVLLLKAKKVSILQTSLVGGILSNILMLLGLSLLIGGVSNHEQLFNRTGAQGSSSLLSIAATSLLIPAAVKQLDQTTPKNLVLQSRGAAVVLLFVYFTYTFCQMVTHKKDYRDTGKRVQHATNNLNQGDPSPSACSTDDNVGTTEHSTTAAAIATGVQTGLPGSIDSQALRKPILSVQDAVEPGNNYTEIPGPHLRFDVAVFVFAVTIVLLFFCIDGTVNSISVLMEKKALSETFVGLILLPIPNCEFAPISLAVDDSLEQTMKYTVGRSIQTALLVEPMVVLIAWWISVGGVTLAFDGFEVVSLFTTILLLNFLVIDAKVHWIHGVLLLADWVLIGIAAYFVTPEVSN
ncbi:uncharacterized protein PAC_06520 [Phialocephala subalpina]|uniref:Sodium/calcium exchanger membrane region domain-containing protein n=1 Tax=Phialocephala subalpina TaxID=576137 RepID=A0A1L7WV26_9HELO|nr:uncharacterized protein PAC_06520 [Phialocephala subalpina]